MQKIRLNGMAIDKLIRSNEKDKKSANK